MTTPTPKVEPARQLAQRAYSMCDEEQPQRTVDALAAAIEADRRAVVAQALAPFVASLAEWRDKLEGRHLEFHATRDYLDCLEDAADRLGKLLPPVEKVSE
jgi:hypothetical protein